MNPPKLLVAGAGLLAVALVGCAPSNGSDAAAGDVIAARGVGAAVADAQSAKNTTSPGPATFEPIERSKEQWRAALPRERYEILFEEDTERPFSSPLDGEKRAGTFVCAACNLPLFESRAKFDSGTGWPSFYQPIAGRTVSKTDYKLIFPRTEYHCARCGGHQGHVFKDGPPPTGERWCNNGLALRFVADGEPLPELVQ